ncbi:hydroxymethylglutaryl-CoA reductase, degradative [Dolosigranulum savutiense]|uniref:3-hydroxy-3-methylglutaryl coenzyme A reductase n=1 Tax=Dolosigranulum savutiense TaxID=3110288 RepID=A0AB74U5Z0_9LACT
MVMDHTLRHFYKKSYAEKLEALELSGLLDSKQCDQLRNQTLDLPHEMGTHMIENFITNYSLPMGLGFHFLIDGQAYTVPMAIEEPSVIAAASFGAKIIGQSGGFQTGDHSRLMIGQVVVENVPHMTEAIRAIEAARDELVEQANAAYPSIVKRGGGARKVEVRTVQADADHTHEVAEFLVVYLYVDTCEAMGANMINTMLEGIAPMIQELTQGNLLMSILSNYATEALVHVTCAIDPKYLKTKGWSGQKVRDRIVSAWQFASADPYRAVTHNKGVMNGIDAVTIATGNDWRATSAAIHAYATRSGQYQPLTQWHVADSGELIGQITIPLALATVGGSIGFHPTAQLAHQILGHPNAQVLAHIVAAVGLAQNFAALRALVTEGIQEGHMSLQARSLAISAGATGDHIQYVADQLTQAPKMNLDTAKHILKNLNQ